MITTLLLNFDLTVQAFSATFLLIATEYIIVSPDFFSALAFISFLTYAYSAANQTVNNALLDSEKLANRELTSVLSTKSSRLDERLAVLEVDKELLLCISQSSARFQSIHSSSFTYVDSLLQDSLYTSASLSHISSVTRHVNGLYTSLLDSSMFGSKGYYTLAKSSLNTNSRNFSKSNSQKSSFYTASILNKRSGSSENSVTVNALHLGNSSKKFALVGAASSVRKGKVGAFKKETFISKIATKLTSRTTDQDDMSKKLSTNRPKKR
jgi:hypothetical protein